MWPGQQQPTGDDPNAPNTPNAPGAQPNPYAQPYAPTVAQGPLVPPGAVPSGPPARGARSTTVMVAVAAAAVVVAAAGVTGYLVLGGEEDPAPRPGPPVAASSPPASPDGRGAAGRPVVAGWKTVVNPKKGIAFDVPPEWGVKAASWVSYVSDENDPEDKPLVGFAAPAMLKEQWCQSDDDRDGTPEDTPLASVGSRGEKDAGTPEEAARKSVELWVYGAYTQPDRDKVRVGAVTPYTTPSGLKGVVATASSSGAAGPGKCDVEGTATTFAFTGPEGEILSWTFLGAAGVSDRVPDATVRRILGTVRLTARTP
ncbi:hypothetical protein [Streptomyces ficellus]|uniref:DUF8017 domain-containing protein n=1 Tax=Streptomyces ficellus TaxID=1977088 RepID=A0A6I6FFB4_9ACTN|nr:hypothetical protein [Streptomyces ficellus]QGV77229.1 hypothetical protein EIZ62_02395 [Streptomyces ficellus]